MTACYYCKKEIVGHITWLAEDYRNEGGDIEGPHPFHVTCADGPWPLFEVSAEQADKLRKEKQNARPNDAE